MRLHRFFIAEKIGDRIKVEINSLELINQISKVFRLKKDDRVIIFDGSGFDYECQIEDLRKEILILKVLKAEASRFVPTRDVFLYQAIVKKDNFEWIVEKATELGVTHIIPVMAERSEKKSLNEERLKKIAIEASEQCGRGDIPTIESIVKLDEKILSNKIAGLRYFVFHTEKEYSKTIKPSFSEGSIAVFIGPEGGWSDLEIDLFHKNNMEIFCLGNQVLRSETAAIIALSQIMF